MSHLVVHRTVVADLLSASGRRVDAVPYDRCRYVIDYVPESLWGAEALAVAWNGKLITLDEARATIPSPSDHLAFVVAPGDGKSIPYIIGGLQIAAGAVAIITGVGTPLGIGLIMSGVGTIGMSLLAPSPKLGTVLGNKSVEGSPTFSLDGFQHTFLPGQPIPVVLGRHRIAGQVTKQFLRVLPSGDSVLYTEVTVSHGRIYAIGGITQDTDGLQGQEIPETFKINGTAARNFKGVRVSVRLGDWNQKPFPELNEQVTSQSDGTEVLFGPGNAHTLSTTQPVTAFEVNLFFPGGLYQLTTQGQKIHLAARYIVRWREKDTDTWLGEETVEVNGPKLAQFSTSYRKDAPLGYDASNAPIARFLDVQVERITADDSGSSNKVSSFIWNTLNEVSEGALSDPGLAKVLYSAVATGQLQGSPPTYTQEVDGVFVHHWDGVSETDPEFVYGYTDGYTTKGDVELSVESWLNLNVTGAPATNSRASFYWTQDGPASGTREIRAVRLVLRKSKTSVHAGVVKVEIRPDSFGAPHASTVLATSESVDTEKIRTSAKKVDFCFSSPINLSTGTKYWAVLVPQYTATTTDWGVIQLGLVGAPGTGDLATYTGSWSSVTASKVVGSLWFKGQCPGRNPAWQAFELLTNRYWGGGKYNRATDADLAAFEEWADENDKCYTTQAGALPVPRWQCGYVMDSRVKLWDFLQKLGSISRTRILKVGRKVRPVVVKPRAVSQIFSQAWMARNSFAWTSESDIEEPTQVEVQFKNETTGFGDDIAPEDDREALNNGKKPSVHRVQMYGLTSRDRSLRAARFILNTSKLHEMVEFQVMPFGVNCLPGDTIGVQHFAYKLSTHGDRVLSSTSTTLRLNALIASGTVYSVTVVTRGTGADVIQTRAVSSQSIVTLASGVTVTELTISSAWNVGDLPAQGDTFALTTESALATPYELFTLHDWRIGEDLRLTLVCSKYDATEEVFDDTPQEVAEATDEILDPLKEPAEVEGLTLTEEVVASCDGGVMCGIRASWSNPQQWNAAEVWIRPTGVLAGGWLFVGQSWDSTKWIGCEYFSAPGGYEVAVRTVTLSGARQDIDDAPRRIIHVRGPWAQPADVEEFTAVALDDRTVQLRWEPVDAADAVLDAFGGVSHAGDPAGYEIRRGPWWSTAEIVCDLAPGPQMEVRVPAEGTHTFWIAAKARYGARSKNPLSVEITVSDAYADVAVTDTTHAAPNGASWTGTATNLSLGPSSQHLRMTANTATYEMPVVNLTTSQRRPVFVYCDVRTGPCDSEKVSQMDFPLGSVIAQRRVAGGGWALDPVDPENVGAADVAYAVGGFYGAHVSAGGNVVSVERRTKVELEIATSTDGVSYSSWTKFEQGMCVDVASFKVRANFTGDAKQRMILISFRVRTVRKKIIIVGSRVLATGGTTINFSPTFPSGVTPLVVAQIVSGAAQEICKITSVSNTSFTAQVLNSGGSGVSRQIYWHAIW